MVPKWCPKGPLDPQNEVPGDPGEVPGDPRDPPETHPGQPGAALGSPGSPLGGHGVAQTAKVVILLKLSVILMNFGSPRAIRFGFGGVPGAVRFGFGGVPGTPYNTVFYRSNSNVF